MTRIEGIVAPSTFSDGRPWLDQDPPSWNFPRSRLTLAEGEIPVRIEGQGRPIGRVTDLVQDERGARVVMDIEPRVVEQLILEVGNSSGQWSIA